MIKRQSLIIITMLGLLISACQALPFFNEAPAETTPILTEQTPTTSPESPEPTLAMDPTPTPESEFVPTEAFIDPTPIEQPEYVIQNGNPIYLPNFTQPEAGCQWLGVAGQVFNKDGQEVQGLIIHAGDREDHSMIKHTAITGQTLAYGPGGYEIIIANNIADSINYYWVQVHGENGEPLSDRVFFNTYDNCEKNLVLINFVAQETTFLPIPTATQQAYP